MPELDVSRLVTDESMSNPVAVAMRYPECPINKICVYITIGSGSLSNLCKYFKVCEERVDCVYDERV